MLTGEKPFAGESCDQTISAILEGSFVPLLERRPELPKTLDEIVKRSLSHDPEKRFESAKELQHAIKGLPRDPDVKIVERCGARSDRHAIAARERDGGARVREMSG